MTAFDCDKCGNALAGERVTLYSEASDERGVDVEIAKRWILCRGCADNIFDAIGEVSPWVDDDFKTIVLPGEEQFTWNRGGVPA